MSRRDRKAKLLLLPDEPKPKAGAGGKATDESGRGSDSGSDSEMMRQWPSSSADATESDDANNIEEGGCDGIKAGGSGSKTRSKTGGRSSRSRRRVAGEYSSAAGKMREKRCAAEKYWGVHCLTPTYNEKGLHAGYQLQCKHPLHGKRCQKTRNSQLAGGDEKCIRELMAWIAWGVTTDSKDDHVKVWADVLEASKNDTLPSCADLESAAIHDCTFTLESFVMGAACSASSSGKKQRRA